MDKRVIVFTTFRSFDGTTNDKIQKIFLQSLKKQTHTNWILAVTIFGEKNVEETLKEQGINYKIYKGEPGPYKFSWSQTFLNGIRAAKEEHGENIVVWASSDTILKSDLFQKIVDLYKPKMSGISYPQTSYSSIERYEKKEGGRYGWYGFDMVFFSSDIFTDKNVASLRQYPNNDWLYFEIFLAAVGVAFCDHRINIQPSCFYTITNDYVSLNQTYQTTKSSGIKNAIELKRFMKDFNVPNNGFYNLILQYKVMGSSLKSLYSRVRIYIQVKYMSSYICRAMPKIKRVLKLKK